MSDSAAFLLVFLIGLGVSLALVPLMDWLGRRLGITARHGGRRVNEGDRRGVSKLGGVALFGGFTVAAIAAQFVPIERFDAYEIIRFIGLMLGGAVIFIFGVLDDFFEFSSFPQFIGQFAAAAIAILFQIFIEYVSNPFTGLRTESFPYIVTVAISLFWLMLMMNTMNWLDGLDGLAGGVTLIAGAMLFINSAFRIDPPQTSVALLPLALMGATLGFLVHNFYPARIFMGGGAQYLGYILGALSIIGGAKMGTILLVLGLPLADVAWQVFNRVLRGRSPFSGDRGHLHFRLQDLGFTQRQIVLGYYAFCLLFGVLTLVISSELYKFIALAVLLAIVAVTLFVLQRRMAGRVPADAAKDAQTP
jgi:UDP-GlcNAc:undecaprenyl-phosphate/decaprenyl-phosphate GlcNAc-1-phosphate transferase